nr:EOG090X0BTZ [Cyclestheria hislopi]
MSTTTDDILHYQRKIQKYTTDEKILLHCLAKLAKLPIGVQHLQETGIGRTVNGMRKTEGSVGEQARALVNKWKAMVAAEDKSESEDEVHSEEATVKEEEDDRREKYHKKMKENKKQESPQKETVSVGDHIPSSSKNKESKNSSKLEENHVSRSSKTSGKGGKEKRHSEKNDGAASSKSSRKRRHPSDEEKHKSDDEDDDDDNKDSSGRSFAEALGFIESSGKKNRKKDKEKNKEDKKKNNQTPALLPVLPKTSTIEIRPTDFEISPHYKPLPQRFAPNSPPHSKNKRMLDEEALSVAMTQKGSRTKVFSGNRSSGLTHVPTLFDFCIRVLQDNIDSLEYTGGVPYDLLRPVLERATPQQLYTLEHFNPYLLEDTDELWKLLCLKEYKNAEREEMETWRDLYLRCHEEREARLKSLTANIQQSMAKATPVRTTKLAYVESVAKPPRSVVRAQMKHGTSAVLASITKAKPSTRPFEASNHSASSTASLTAEPVKISAVTAARASSSSSNTTAVKKPKVAPLMQKTLKFIKNRYRR